MALRHNKYKAKFDQQQRQHNHTANNKRSGPSIAPDPFGNMTGGRATETHVYFWNGILSNWHCDSPNFSGARCFELMLPILDKQEIPHPAPDALSSRLMSDHMFNCGEQWMMAMKGWIFERHISTLCERCVDVEHEESTELYIGRKEYDLLRKDLMAAERKEGWKPYKTGEGNVLTEEGKMYESTICKVLRSKDPHDQKVHGRHTQKFDPYLWKQPSIASTVAACVARAEVDVHLREIYLASADKRFVEGSPRDEVWGVGLDWKRSEIEDETKWRGENRLGICHDMAGRKIRELFEQNVP